MSRAKLNGRSRINGELFMINKHYFPATTNATLAQRVIIAALASGTLLGVVACGAPHAGSAGQINEPTSRTSAEEGGTQTQDKGYKTIPYREFQQAFEINAEFPVIVEIPTNYVLFKLEDEQMDRRVFWIPEDAMSEARATQTVPNRGRFLVMHTFDVLYESRSKVFQGEEAMKKFAKRFEKLHFDDFIVIFMELEKNGSYIYVAYLVIASDRFFTDEWLEGKYQGSGNTLWGTVLQVSFVPPNSKKTEESDEVWMRFTGAIVSSAIPLLHQK